MPKQFLALTGGASLLANTLSRLKTLNPSAPALCIAANDVAQRTREELVRSGIPFRLALEPEARNTAPAIAAAAFIAQAEDPDAVLIVLPADHLIDDYNGFAESATTALTAATIGQIIVLGVRPTEPSPDFGYIMPDATERLAPVRVARFVEKPNAERAAQLIESGALWNAGMVVARADTIIAALNLHEPRVSAAVRQAVVNAKPIPGGLLLDYEAFAQSPSIAFDHAVLERHGFVRVVPLEAGWRDLGNWAEVAALVDPDTNDNRLKGDIRLVDSRRNFLFSPNRLTVGLGLEDIVVINTPDALLVAHKDCLGLLGDTVKALISEARPEVLSHSLSQASGFAETDGSNAAVTTRTMTLGPYERHKVQNSGRHCIHWIVVAGEAIVQSGGTAKTLTRNHSHFVPSGAESTLENRGPGSTEIVELQIEELAAHG